MSTFPGVRRAGPADVPAVARALGRAFDDDPIFQALIPLPSPVRIERLTRFFARALRVIHLPLGEAWITDDGRAAAIFAPPGRWKVSVWQQIRMIPTVTVFRGNALLGERMHAIIERVHPADAHWYLAVLGVDPDVQGRGLGSRVLAPILERCDREGIDAYLESSNEKNHAFYRRQGFQITDTVTMPRDLRVWPMRRAAREA
jgi:ribosomal protein S18 acetylase RimI-like enzyme